MVEDAVMASWALISESCTEKCQNTIDRFFTGTWPAGTSLVPDVVVLQLHMQFSIKLAHRRFYGMEQSALSHHFTAVSIVMYLVAVTGVKALLRCMLQNTL